MFKLKNETLQGISESTGIALDRLFDCERVEIALDFSTKLNSGIVGRGNPYCSKKRFTKMQDVDKQIDKMIKDKKGGSRTSR